MKDRHQETLLRQENQQQKLETSMNQQETQQQRDKQLQALDLWLEKQEKATK
ncbi:MAG: hypothetical protein ACM3UY_09770 [Methanocella sp.]